MEKNEKFRQLERTAPSSLDRKARILSLISLQTVINYRPGCYQYKWSMDVHKKHKAFTLLAFVGYINLVSRNPLMHDKCSKNLRFIFPKNRIVCHLANGNVSRSRFQQLLSIIPRQNTPNHLYIYSMTQNY